MQPKKNIIDCYDKTAARYADKYMNELDGKHLDRILLQSFAAENNTGGKMIDLGCGPGQTTRFLYDCGITDITGTDISPEMISVAQKLYPQVCFETADMLQLQYADQSFGSAVAFYAIVHFDMEALLTALKEVNRILVPGGEFLFSFHTGTETVHMDRFLDEAVSIDFHFFETAKVLGLLQAAGFAAVDILERRPYPDVEYPSTRAYIWVRKTNR